VDYDAGKIRRKLDRLREKNASLKGRLFRGKSREREIQFSRVLTAGKVKLMRRWSPGDGRRTTRVDGRTNGEPRKMGKRGLEGPSENLRHRRVAACLETDGRRVFTYRKES